MSTTVPHTFPFWELLQELREMIIPHALSLQPDLQPPPFLLVLAREPAVYQRAQQVYKKTNYVVWHSTIAALKRLPMKRVLKLLHLTLIYSPSRATVILKGSNKIALRNNLETVTVDLTRSTSFRKFFWYRDVYRLIAAGDGNITRLVLVLPPGTNPTEFIDLIHSQLGIVGIPQTGHDNLSVIVWQEVGQVLLERNRGAHVLINRCVWESPPAAPEVDEQGAETLE